ncbi:Radical SAM, Pyruvate-formate lyase-activating enzyme like [Desulfovibrionales bacterium]
MAQSRLPKLIFADTDGNVYDHPELHMLVRRGRELVPPRPNELSPLPEESRLYLLPGRHAVGLDLKTGRAEVLNETAVAVFVCPGYTTTGVAAYYTPGHRGKAEIPTLPLFAYTGVGFHRGRFYVAARLVDTDRRQIFTGISEQYIHKEALALQKHFPKNRLLQHLTNCALNSCCPAARNLCLGRFEAPLPTARSCNARCVGCISMQTDEFGFPATQSRITSPPNSTELIEIMTVHAIREPQPILSFGQGCEGEPLIEGEVIADAIRTFRIKGGRGTVNINTNGSLPTAIPALVTAGASSIRVSLNSAQPELYTAYYRPHGYVFNDVRTTITMAKAYGCFVSLNLLYFPGITDTESELKALSDLIAETKLDLIQLRNLNLDPELYLELAGNHATDPSMGFNNFKKRLSKAFPWLSFGYFNPYLKDRLK